MMHGLEQVFVHERRLIGVENGSNGTIAKSNPGYESIRWTPTERGSCSAYEY